MPGKIKCTYEECFKHFSSNESMKKHKSKEHDGYCKKCDLDCEDDLEYLYHQIVSQKHMACPICGREFQSESGRDRHVEIEHVPKQNLECPGCQYKFDRASSLMAHIERDECEVIKVEHFNRQKAEKEITQDAWAAALDPTAGATILSNARVFPTAENEMNLLDDERAFVNTDWQGRPHYDDEQEHNGPYVGPPSEQMSNLSISRFPPLGPQTRIHTEKLPLITDTQSEAHDTNDIPLPQLPSTGAWSKPNATTHLFNSKPNTTTSTIPPPSITTSINLLDSFTEEDLNNHPRNNPLPISSISQHTPSSLAAQPSLAPPNPDPNAAHAHLKTHTPLHQPSTLPIDSFYDPVLNAYICPALNCGGHYATHDAFRNHLTRPPHVGEKVTCPGCYKKFKTTHALISHCESGSRRCSVRNALDFDRVVKNATAGMLGVDGLTEEGGVRYVARPVQEW